MSLQTYRTAITIDMQGQAATMVHHFQILDPTEPNDFFLAKQLNIALNGAGAPTDPLNELTDLLSEDCFVSSISSARIHPTYGNSHDFVFQRDDHVGQVASPWHTGQLAGVIIWITPDRSSITGRTFVPGVAEEDLVGGRFDASYKTNIDQYADSLSGGFTTAGGLWNLVIWDRVAHLGYTVEDFYLSLKPGTMRRREVPL